jgi:hypothetical protein
MNPLFPVFYDTITFSFFEIITRAAGCKTIPTTGSPYDPDTCRRRNACNNGNGKKKSIERLLVPE